MKLEITIDVHHFHASTPGAGSNMVARAINDRLHHDYRSTINGWSIHIWDKSFGDHSLLSIPLPGRISESMKSINEPDTINIRLDDLPIRFDISIPAEYHRPPGRNLEEDFEFMERHGE